MEVQRLLTSCISRRPISFGVHGVCLVEQFVPGALAGSRLSKLLKGELERSLACIPATEIEPLDSRLLLGWCACARFSLILSCKSVEDVLELREV